MSIERTKGDSRVIFRCDWCGREYAGKPGETFGQTWERAKAEGWRSHKNKAGKWVHRDISHRDMAMYPWDK